MSLNYLHMGLSSGATLWWKLPTTAAAFDAKGQEYRLVPNTDKTRYDMEPTSQTWTWEQLLDVAVADARLLKKDTDALHRCVTDVPVEKRIPVLMKGIDDLPAAPRLVIVVIILFLVAFFVPITITSSQKFLLK